MSKVTFDGVNKLITVNDLVTNLDVTIDLYSDWKEWAKTGDNLKYLPAFSAIGGEPIGGGKYAGSTFFVINGWTLRPYEGNHTLTIDGNIFGEGGVNFTVPTLGSYTVAIQYTNSNLVQAINIAGGSGSSAQELWEYANRTLTEGVGLSTEEHDALIDSRDWARKAGSQRFN